MWNLLLVMIFRQCTKGENLRDLIVALEAHGQKLYNLGKMIAISLTETITTSSNSYKKNAVNIQVYYAIITFCLAGIAKRYMRLKRSAYKYCKSQESHLQTKLIYEISSINQISTMSMNDSAPVNQVYKF